MVTVHSQGLIYNSILSPYIYSYKLLKRDSLTLPWWSTGKIPRFQCRGCEFHPRSGNKVKSHTPKGMAKKKQQKKPQNGIPKLPYFQPSTCRENPALLYICHIFIAYMDKWKTSDWNTEIYFMKLFIKNRFYIAYMFTENYFKRTSGIQMWAVACFTEWR